MTFKSIIAYVYYTNKNLQKTDGLTFDNFDNPSVFYYFKCLLVMRIQSVAVSPKPIQTVQSMQKSQAVAKAESPAEEKRETPAMERSEHQSSKIPHPTLGNSIDLYV